MRVVGFATFLVVIASGVLAEDGKNQGLSLELNTVADANGGCQVTFVAENHFPSPIEQAIFETVLFDTNGAVNRLTLFDFGAIPVGRPRVRQFVIPDLACTDLSQILINGVHTCDAPGLTNYTCDAGLTVKSRVDVELIG